MKNKVIKLLVIIVTILIIIDQASKILVTNILKDESIGNENFGIIITSNTGMAFGFNDGNGKNIFLTICILAIIASFIKNQLERIDTKTTVALSLAISGGISNLIDRIFRGGVFDFIRVFTITFNLADILIVLGWILLIVFLIDYSRKN